MRESEPALRLVPERGHMRAGWDVPRTAARGNGRGTPMTEAELEDAIEALCGEYGVFRFHVPDSRKMRRGLPDDILIGLRGVLWRECKTSNNQLSTSQRVVAARLIRSGEDFRVWRPDDLRSGKIAADIRKVAW